LDCEDRYIIDRQKQSCIIVLIPAYSVYINGNRTVGRVWWEIIW